MILFVRSSIMETICPSISARYSLSSSQHSIQCVNLSTQDILSYPTIPIGTFERGICTGSSGRATSVVC